MKSFYEMMIILESHNDEEQAAYDKINQALTKAGLPWDEDELKVLYGKWVDMTVWFHPGGTQRVQGVILPEEIEEREDHYGAYGVGFKINGKDFSPENIEEIHGIRVSKTYEDILDGYRDDRDYDATLRSLPY